MRKKYALWLYILWLRILSYECFLHLELVSHNLWCVDYFYFLQVFPYGGELADWQVPGRTPQARYDQSTSVPLHLRNLLIRRRTC